MYVYSLGILSKRNAGHKSSTLCSADNVSVSSPGALLPPSTSRHHIYTDSYCAPKKGIIVHGLIASLIHVCLLRHPHMALECSAPPQVPMPLPTQTHRQGRSTQATTDSTMHWLASPGDLHSPIYGIRRSKMLLALTPANAMVAFVHASLAG